jgi:hypothetical protein
MTRWTDLEVVEISRTSQLAHTIEHIGLAMLGALCGLFVAALIAKANIESINSVGALFAAMLYTSVGFYVGIDIPAVRVNIVGVPRAKTNTIRLLNATGTLLTASAALISVIAIVFDAGLHIVSIASVAAAWFSGTAMQITAGCLARAVPQTRTASARDRSSIKSAA